MTKFQVLVSITDVKEFSLVIHTMANTFKTAEEIQKKLETELSEEELQMLKSAAQKGYPLSSDFKQ